MTEPNDNLILHLLREMRTEAQQTRAENTAQFEKIQGQIAVLAKGQGDVRNQLKILTDKFDVMSTHVQEMAIVLDHHSMRLDRIDQHLGLDEPRH